MVADHPAVCGEVSSLDVCDLDADLYGRGTIGPPGSVETALVVSARPATTGTFGIAPACHLGTSAQVSFVVRDATGEELLRDEAIQGMVTIEELEPGVRASGRYDVVLRSGASVAGRFVGAFCSAVSAFAVIPPHRTCSHSSAEAYLDESCSCRGHSVASACSRSTASEPWTCLCTDAQGGTSTCTLPADAPRSSCPTQSFTCCSMLL
jgi:hypothetical protein